MLSSALISFVFFSLFSSAWHIDNWYSINWNESYFHPGGINFVIWGYWGCMSNTICFTADCLVYNWASDARTSLFRLKKLQPYTILHRRTKIWHFVYLLSMFVNVYIYSGYIFFLVMDKMNSTYTIVYILHTWMDRSLLLN